MLYLRPKLRSSLSITIKLALLFLLLPITACSQPYQLDYPPAERIEQVDEYHGVKVADPFRWMEDLEDENLHDWMKAEDELRAAYLSDSGVVKNLQKRIRAIGQYASESIPIERGKYTFKYKRAPGQTFGSLFVSEGYNHELRKLLDIEAMNDGNGSAGISSFSQNGEYLTLRTAEGQSRWYQQQIVRVADGEHLPEKLTGFYGGRSNFAWTHDNVGFFYARYPVPDNPQEPLGIPQIYYHKIGTEQHEDALVYELPESPTISFNLRVTHDGRYLILNASESGGTFNGLYERLFYKDLSDESSLVIELFPDIDASFAFEGSDGDVFRIRTTYEAPNNRLIELKADRPNPSDWKELIPEASESIQAVSEIGSRLIVQYIQDARIVVHGFDLDGNKQFEIDQLSPSMSGFSDNRKGNVTYFSGSTLYDPGTIYKLDVSTGVSSLHFRPELNHDPDEFEQKQAFYTSKDGTRVPMFILHKKGLELDGNNPVFMYGYGAWSWAAFPWQIHMIPWMEIGGVYVVANIRGGGEYGEDWHQAGIRQNKQTGIDDFIAAAEWLIDNGYTSPSKVVANGGSASGVLPGAAMIQRPDLFAASVINFPTLDKLRYDRFGSAKSWASEFGLSEDPKDFEALHAYSPYHNLEKGTCYPATWVQVGENDETTTPMHGYKFVAALQEKQGCANPVLLKITWGAGHSYGKTPEQRSETQAEELAFLVKALGLTSGLVD